MEAKIRGGKLFHRLKYRNSIVPTAAPFVGESLKSFDINLKKRHNIMQYMNKIVKKTKAGVKVAPLYRALSTSHDNDIQEFCRNCPSTPMSRFQERAILKRVNARGLENNHPILLKKILAETRDEFLKITHQSGIEMKLKTVEKKFTIRPYKNLGRTENYPIFLQRRRQLLERFILHQPLVRRILHECVNTLPYELFDLNKSFKTQLDVAEFKDRIFDCAKDAAQYLQEFYGRIVNLVEQDPAPQGVSNYLGACTGLLSVNISRTIAHTLLHVVTFTGSKEHIPYLKLNITFNEHLILHPTADEIIDIYDKFLARIINTAKQFHALERRKGNDNKNIHLCLTSEFFDSILEKISHNIKSKYEPILEYITTLDDGFSDIYSDLASRGTTISTSDSIFEEGCEKILRFKSYLPKVAFIPDNAYFSLGQLILTEYRETLKETLLAIIENIFSNLRAQHEWENNDICEAFEIINVRATQKPITTEEVIEIGKYMAWVKTEFLDELKERVIKALEYLTKLIQLGPLTEHHILTNAKAINWLDEISPILEENSSTYEQLKFEAEEKLQRVIEDINIHIKNIYPLLDILDSMDNIENVRNYLNSITLHMVKIKEIEVQIDWINREEVSLSFPKSSYAEFEELKNYVHPFYHLLKLCLDVQRNLSVWLDGQFDLINYEKTKQTVENYYKELVNTQKVYRNKLRQAQDENLSLRFKGTVDDPDMLNWPAPLKLCSKAIKLIQDFEPSLTVIKIMCNEALMKRHWIEMSRIAGFDITPNAGTTLKKINKIDLEPNIDKYELISLAATREKNLFEDLQLMQQEWSAVKFTIKDCKEIRLIARLEDIDAVADDHIIKVINMFHSIFVKPFHDQVANFYKGLLKIKKTVYECNELQFHLLELHPLFSCGKVSQQMPTESKLFQQINAIYQEYLESIQRVNNVQEIVTETNILEDFIQCNEKFEIVMRGVCLYFEKIRQYFSRFYFLSNNEICHVISLTKLPNDINQFIKKLFPFVQNLQFNEEFDVVAFVNQTNESIELLEPIKVNKSDARVEIWLKELEKKSFDLNRHSIHCGFKNYDMDFKDLPNQNCQTLLTVSKIYFTSKCQEAVNQKSLQNFYTEWMENFTRISIIVKDENIDNLTKVKIKNFLIQTLNYSNIIQSLIRNQVKTEEDFQWKAHLRYYIYENDCIVKILNTTINYGYEFSSNFETIVVTPTTERCYRSLMMAYQSHFHGICQGETATGKTSTVESLANALGVLCVFFNCSFQISLEIITNFLKGIASLGCWLCLEDAENITGEILSVLTQEISRISSATKSELAKITIDHAIKLTQCFICFNMKTSGEKVPENLKSLLRPITMIKPDCEIISEVTLLAAGFEQSRSLAGKIIIARNLFQDLLPIAKINFGIGIIKQILLRSAELFYQGDPEELAVYKAIRSINSSKLSQANLKLFDKILSSLFPSLPSEPPSLIYDDFIAICQKLNYKPKEKFLSKAKQLQEIMNFKQGIVIIGRVFTGKSAIVKVLTSMNSEITIEFINPKTLTLEQLYGSVDQKTQQWSDGVIGNSLRVNTKSWVILDGDLDPTWLENCNSLLEENQRLYLTSGEILLSPNKKIIIFETDNLKKSSPAMISRCGIVYMDSNTVGWESLIESWNNYKDLEWKRGHEDLIKTLCMWTIPACLDFIKSSSHQLCEIDDISLVKTMNIIFEILLSDAFDACGKKEDDLKNITSWIQAGFILSVLWGLGANLDSDSRSKFDEFFKLLWKGQNTAYPYPKSLEKVEVSTPPEGTIFDHSYIFKAKGNWKYWPDTLKNEKIESSIYLTDFIVPTTETVKYSWLLSMHVNRNIPALFFGPQTTGKTLLFNDFLINKLEKNKFESSTITFTPKLSPRHLQKLILAKLFKKKSGSFGPSDGKNGVLFIDDLGAAKKDDFGSRASLEVLRQLLEHRILFSLESTTKAVNLQNLNIIAATNKIELPQRFIRHFNVFSLNELSDESVIRIYSNILLLKWKKAGFPSDIGHVVNQIIHATYDFYKTVKSQLKPSIHWNVYSFNLRNISKIIQVCSLIKKESTDGNRKIFTKLWIHEIFRVFGDRLLKQDEAWFMENVRICTEKHFGEESEQLLDNFDSDMISKLFFGTYSNQCERFDEISYEKLKDIVVNFVNDYNKENSQPIDIVLFDYALEHLSRILRVLATPRTNLLQLGMCGSGRQTLVKIGCFMFNQKCFDLKITKFYGINEWKSDLKRFLKEAGCYGKPCTFFLRQNNIIDELFLEDIDHLIKTGEVPELYSLTDKQEVLDLVRNILPGENSNIDISSDVVFLYHQRQCLENLHIVFCFNFQSSIFRKYLRTYPSIKDFSEIVCYENWPEETLNGLATTGIQPLNIPDDVKDSTIQSFSHIHCQAKNLTNDLCISEGFYLEFIKIYIDLITIKLDKISRIKQRYVAALEKLSYAAFQISEMQESLADYQPQLEAMTIKAIEMAEQIEKETIEVEIASNLVKKDEKTANEQAAAAQLLKLDCEADLAQAIPILEDAISALNTLKPTDITLVKSMKNPPDAIKLVMAAVCVIKDVKPDRIPDPSTGRKTLDYWGPSKRILGDMNFLQTLKDFDKDNIKPEIMVKIRKDYLPHKDFKPHIVAKASSAAEGLCKWIIAMDMYDKVAKEVAPKKEKLEKAEQEYANTMEILNEKKEQVARIEQKLADLNELLREAIRKQQKLQRNVDICKRKLARAQKLIGGLSEEKIRWTAAVDELEVQHNCLPGDMLLSSAVVAYLGYVDKNDRQRSITQWFEYIQSKQIPCSQNFDFIETFSKDVDFVTWCLDGLPIDDYFIQNGLIATYSKRWPLFIDPQRQASSWIKNLEKYNGIKCTKFSCHDHLRRIIDCITTGKPILVESIEENLETYLYNLICKITEIHNDVKYINIEGELVLYDENFVLYLTTNLKRPQYSPDVFDKITVINFSMTTEALQEQLLSSVIEVEKPSLKKLKETLNKENRMNKDSFNKIEEKILSTLSQSTTEILEDENALQILDDSKILSKKIEEKLKTLIVLQEPLDEYKSNYRSVAQHATILYFSTFQLSKINHMYQYSLDWYVYLFVESIQKARKHKDLHMRRISLIDTLTNELFNKVSRTILEEHKILFPFLIAVNLSLFNGKISQDEVNFLTTTGSSSDLDQGPNWLPHGCWSKICELDNISSFQNFSNFFLEKIEVFQDIHGHRNPEKVSFPEPYNKNFSKLMIIAAMRPDRLYMAVKNFICSELGEGYINPPPFDISKSFIESHILSPLIFILTAGSDPLNSLCKLAEKKHYENKLEYISLMKGAEMRFEIILQEAQQKGLWICLQNCHLITSWLRHLDLKLEEMDYNNTHENFRLWLTTEETKEFPIGLLERSVKITKQPPCGFRNKILDLFTDEPVHSEEFYSSCPGKHELFTKLLFSLTIFHCVLQERQKFGEYGWSSSYEVGKRYFDFSAHQLQSAINQDNNSLESVLHLIGECIYAGFTTNSWDTRLISTMIGDYYNPAVQSDNSFTFKGLMNYGFPIKTDYQDYVNHILKLPNTDNPNMFGLHDNYDVIKGSKYSNLFVTSLEHLLNETSNNNNTNDPRSIIHELFTNLPQELPLDNNTISPLEDSIMNSILFTEIQTYNKLINRIVSSLNVLLEIVEGKSSMDEDSKIICDSFLNNSVPSNWIGNSYTDNLGMFITDLHSRRDFLDKFCRGIPENVCLQYLFRPKSFLIAAKMAYSRQISNPIQDISFCLCTNTDNAQGITINKLYLVGARWNDVDNCLDELEPKTVHNVLFNAVLSFVVDCPDFCYECPLFQTLHNFNSGLSLDVIAPVLLNSRIGPAHWIKRSVSLYCKITL